MTDTSTTYTDSFAAYLKDRRAKRRADAAGWAKRNTPVTREELDHAHDTLTFMVAMGVRKESDLLRGEMKHLDGKSALLGAGRTVAKANVDSIVRAVEPVVQRRAVLTKGRAPAWAAPLFSGGTA